MYVISEKNAAASISYWWDNWFVIILPTVIDPVLYTTTMLVRLLRYLLGRPRAAYHFHTTASSWESRKVLRTVELPDMPGGTECEVIKWCECTGRTFHIALNLTDWLSMVYRLVQPKASVQPDQSLCQIETDKATVEVPSPFGGVIKELLVHEGDIVKEGVRLCVLEVEEGIIEGSEPAPVEPVVPLSVETKPINWAAKISWPIQFTDVRITHHAGSWTTFDPKIVYLYLWEEKFFGEWSISTPSPEP